MNLVETLKVLNEAVKKKKGKVESFKGRMKTFDTIKDALSKTQYGDIWTTDGSDRPYVTTKGKWGSHKGATGDAAGRGKVAKGFTKGSATPNASFPSIRGYSARTRIRHGKSTARRLIGKYGTQKQKREKEVK